jgi:hypothetical protein
MHRCDEEENLADILRIEAFRVHRGNPRMHGLHVQVCHNISEYLYSRTVSNSFVLFE